MANFPTSLDALTNPASGDLLTSPSHSAQHGTANDILEALEAKMGIGASTPVAGRVFGSTVTGSSAWAAVPLVDGIEFPATQVPSADANTLDDYEEGSWTPVLTFVTAGDQSIAYSSQIGRYTKIGHRCWVTFLVTTSTFTHTTASGNLRITGLPFTAPAATSARGYLAVGAAGWTKANYTMIAGRVVESNTAIQFAAFGSGQALVLLGFGDMPTGGTVNLQGTGSYVVA